MAKLITRYFDDVKTAKSVIYELVNRQRFSRRIITLYAEADGLTETLTQAGVDAKTAKAYHKAMTKGGAVLSVRAGYKPLGVAQTTRKITASMGAADLGALAEEVVVADDERPLLSVMQDHPLFLTRLRDPDSDTYHMADWPIPLISRRKPLTGSIIEPHARMASWPFGLISKRKPYKGSLIPRHARMANVPIPLLSQRRPFTGSIFPRHARMANFPIPLLSRRKPFDGTLIGRHTRMANWPFPNLINGKTGTNSLIPGGPRMANFPISLLSRRKPYTGSIFSRHARMASFPIPLLSNRKPFTGSLIPKHARMADTILPLVTSRSKQPAEGKRFSLSGALGLPTIVRR